MKITELNTLSRRAKFNQTSRSNNDRWQGDGPSSVARNDDIAHEVPVHQLYMCVYAQTVHGPGGILLSVLDRSLSIATIVSLERG
jgi:hypothetical protein